MSQINYDNPAYEVWKCCYDVHQKLPSNGFFIDDERVIDAIKSNNPAKVASLGNSFIKKICKSISVFKKSKSEMKMNDVTYTFYLNLDQKNMVKRRKEIITLQLALWSCVSDQCYKLITAALIGKGMIIDVPGDDEISWSWMESLVQCVSCRSKFVYQLHATDDQKQYCACHVLSLVDSLFRILFHLLQVYKSLKFDPIRFILTSRVITLSFKVYCQRKLKEENIPNTVHSLEYFLDYQDDTFTLNSFLSCLEMRKKVNMFPQSINTNIAGERGNNEELLQPELGLLSNVAVTLDAKNTEHFVTQNKDNEKQHTDRLVPLAESLVTKNHTAETIGGVVDDKENEKKIQKGWSPKTRLRNRWSQKTKPSSPKTKT